jgi:hypothetical protein
MHSRYILDPAYSICTSVCTYCTYVHNLVAVRAWDLGQALEGLGHTDQLFWSRILFLSSLTSSLRAAIVSISFLET